MAHINYEQKKIHCKLALIGPEGSGKTETLRSIYKALDHDLKDGRLRLGPPLNQPQFFEFMPLSLGKVGEYDLRLHLYSLPARFFYKQLPQILLKGLDGYMFIADSRVQAFEGNLNCMNDFTHLFEKEGLTSLPHVVSYNKRDLEGVVPTSILREYLNPHAAPDLETVAKDGSNVMESLIAMTKMLLRRLAPEYV